MSTATDLHEPGTDAPTPLLLGRWLSPISGDRHDPYNLVFQIPDAHPAGISPADVLVETVGWPSPLTGSILLNAKQYLWHSRQRVLVSGLDKDRVHVFIVCGSPQDWAGSPVFGSDTTSRANRESVTSAYAVSNGNLSAGSGGASSSSVDAALISDQEWAPKDRRRGELIDKKHSTGLTAEEDEELSQLQAEMKQRLDAIAPISFAALEALEQFVRKIEARYDKQSDSAPDA